jgi:aryl-alcohol dehydrogenase-like predicted oxidoreductase
LVRSGKVRYIGTSNTQTWRIEAAHWISKANGWAEFCCVQQRFSYVRPKTGVVFDPHCYVDNDLLDYARTRGLTILAYSPLFGGAYTRSDKSFGEEFTGPDTDTRLAVLREVAGETGASPNQIVLAWMLRSDPPVIPLVAASRPEHLRENIESLKISLTVDQLDRLSQAGNIVQRHATPQRAHIKGMKEG